MEILSYTPGVNNRNQISIELADDDQTINFTAENKDRRESLFSNLPNTFEAEVTLPKSMHGISSDVCIFETKLIRT